MLPDDEGAARNDNDGMEGIYEFPAEWYAGHAQKADRSFNRKLATEQKQNHPMNVPRADQAAASYMKESVTMQAVRSRPHC